MILTRSDMRIVEVRVGFVCNKCGFVYDHEGDDPEGLVGCEVTGGYGARWLVDSITYTFSICEKCLSELFDTFAVPVKQFDRNGFNDPDPAETEGVPPVSLVEELFGDLPEGADTPVTFTAEEVAEWHKDDEPFEPEEPLPGFAILPEPEKT